MLKVLLLAAVFCIFALSVQAADFGVGISIGASNCTESWVCTDWSEISCGTRTCTDSNSCGTTTGKPSESSVCPESPAPSGGGGGGGGSIAKKNLTAPSANLSIVLPAARDTRKLSIVVDADIYPFSASPGELKHVSFSIANTGTQRLMFNVTLEGISSLASLDTAQLDLQPGSSQNITLAVFVPKEEPPGTYTGEIKLKGLKGETAISIKIDVSPISPLFDVGISIMPKAKIIFPGEELSAGVNILNLQENASFVVDVLYGVKDGNNTIIMSRQQTVHVQAKTSMPVLFNVPKYIRPRVYSLFSVVSLNGTIVGVGSDTFEVMAPPGLSDLAFGIAIVMAILLILLSYVYRHRR